MAIGAPILAGANPSTAPSLAAKSTHWPSPVKGDIHLHADALIAPSLSRTTALTLLPSRNPFAKPLPGEPFLSGNQSLARRREPGELLGL